MLERTMVTPAHTGVEVSGHVIIAIYVYYLIACGIVLKTVPQTPGIGGKVH